MIFTILTVICLAIGIPSTYLYYKRYIFDEIDTKIFILSSIFIYVPIVNLIMLMVETLDGEFEAVKFKYAKRDLNRARKCNECGITSRDYQINNNKCPHCSNNKSYRYSNMSFDNKYPFAPKLNSFGVIKHKRYNNKVNKINSDLRQLNLYDEELEAWENLQLKKLKDLESEAERIKQEIKNNEKLKSTSNFDFIEN